MVNSFPSVTTKETQITPPQKRKEWRNTLGIVANFRKGPPIARVKSRDDLANFFGDDDKDGPITIRSAMENGVNDFVVARPIPSDTSAEVSFRLTTEGTPQQAFVDGTGNVATKGISLLAEYVSNISTLTPHTSTVKAIKKNLNSDLEGSASYGSESFKSYIEGQGILNFRSELFLEGASTPASSKQILDSLLVYNPTVNGSKLYDSVEVSTGEEFVVIAEIPSLDGISAEVLEKTLKENIHPGIVLGLTATTLDVETDAEVMSPIETYYNSEQDKESYRFALKLTASADNPSLGTEDWVELIDTASPTLGKIKFPTESKYVFSYNWNSLSSNARFISEKGTYISGMFPSYTQNDLVDGYMVVSQEAGTKEVKIFNFFLQWNRDQAIQLEPRTPLNPIDLNINSVEELSSTTMGFSPSKLLMLDSQGSVYDQLLHNINTPSSFAVRIDHAMAYVGRPFFDTAEEMDALDLGTSYEKVLKSLFSQLNEKEATREIFSDFSLDISFDKTISKTYIDTKLETRSIGLSANNMTIRVALTGDISGSTPPDDATGNEWTIEGSSKTLKIDKEESSFSLAQTGASRASRIFYTDTGEPLIEVVALSPGKTDLEVSIIQGRSGQFDLVVIDRDSEEYYDAPLVERIRLTNNGAQKVTGGRYPNSVNSRLIRAFYLPKLYDLPKKQQEELITKNPARVGANLGTYVSDANTFNSFEGIPSVSTLAIGENFLNNVKLKGGVKGSNSDNPSNADYLEAVSKLEEFDLVAIATPDIKFNGNVEQPVIKEMIRQASESETFNGFRQAVFQLPRKLPVSRVKSIVPELLNNERVILVGGFMTYEGNPERGFNSVPQLGTYLGWTFGRSPQLSPASIGEGEVIQGIVSTTIPGDKAYLSAMSENGIDGIYFDKTSQRMRCINGQTTSTDIEGQYVSVVRTYDQLLTDITNRLTFIRSQPLSDELMNRAMGISDTRLEYAVNRGWIQGFSATIADERNNSEEDLRRGILKVKLNIDVYIPADHIVLNLLRQRTRTLTLQSQA